MCEILLKKISKLIRRTKMKKITMLIVLVIAFAAPVFAQGPVC